jgi:hypothetical protein
MYWLKRHKSSTKIQNSQILGMIISNFSQISYLFALYTYIFYINYKKSNIIILEKYYFAL